MPLSSVRWTSVGILHATPPCSSTAVICIHNPGHPPLAPRGWGAVLDLRFWDVDDSGMPAIQRIFAGALGRHPELCAELGQEWFGRNGWPWRPCLTADAEAALTFVAALPAEVEHLLVSCEYGRSRSRAVAEFVAARHGLSSEGPEGSVANTRVTRLLTRAERRM